MAGSAAEPTPREGVERTCDAARFSDRQGMRLLHIGPPRSDDLVQGVMQINDPQKLVLEFAERMMVWAMFFKPSSLSKRHVMQLGLGAASLTKFCHGRIGMKTTAVEINPSVVAICRDAFHLPPNDKLLEVITGDARKEIARPRWRAALDVIQVDAYDADAARPVLDSVDFYQACKRALGPDGCIVTNLFSADASYETSLEHLRMVFGADALWQFKPTKEGNTIVLAEKKPRKLGLAEYVSRCQELQNRYGLDTQPWLHFFHPVTA